MAQDRLDQRGDSAAGEREQGARANQRDGLQQAHVRLDVQRVSHVSEKMHDA
jgi:hypothetical protein